MFKEINSALRKLFLIIGALAVISELAGSRNKADDGNRKKKNGYQSEEFDDLW